MFIFDLTYPPEKAEKHLAAHREFLDKYYAAGKLICSGRKNPWTGGIIFCKAQTYDEAVSIAHEDPFYINGVTEDYKVVEFEPSKFAEDFKKFL